MIRYAKILAMAMLAAAPGAYAQVKISALPDGVALVGDEQIPSVQAGATTKATPAQISTFTSSQIAGSSLYTVNGAWTFASAAFGTISSIKMQSTAPQLEFNNSNAPANNRRVIEYTDNAGTHRAAICQDNTTCNDFLQITRTGSSVNAIKFLTNNATERLAINSNGSWTIGAGTGTTGQVLTSTGASTAPTWQDVNGGQTIASGIYTPTCTPMANIAASTCGVSSYMRVGSTVTLSLTLSIDPTAASTSQLDVSLPVPSGFTASENVAGVCHGRNISDGGTVQAQTVDDRLSLFFLATVITNNDWSCSITYRVL